MSESPERQADPQRREHARLEVGIDARIETYDGKLPARGLVPTLIQWDVPSHPAPLLPVSNVSLGDLASSHPEPALIREALTALGLDGRLAVTYDRDTRLAAMLRTPRGIVTLSS